jgi:hypothetical protein
MLIGFHVGLYGQFALSDALTLQPEVLYYGAGDKQDDEVWFSRRCIRYVYVYR